jgi:peroxiredoxin
VEETYRQLKDKVQFIGITADKKEEIMNFIKKYDLGFPVVRDESKALFKLFNARIPAFIFIDSHGIVRYDESEPSDNILKYLEEPIGSP